MIGRVREYTTDPQTTPQLALWLLLSKKFWLFCASLVTIVFVGYRVATQFPVEFRYTIGVIAGMVSYLIAFSAWGDGLAE